MTLQDWVALAKSIIGIAVLGLAILYFLEWNPPFNLTALIRAHRNIWKKPKRWQLVTVWSLWVFIIAAAALLFSVSNSH